MIFKSTPGSKRWQHASSAKGLSGRGDSSTATTDPRPGPSPPSSAPSAPSAPPAPAPLPPEEEGDEPSYTVILGSHRNSCLKFERGGVTVASARHGPGASASPPGDGDSRGMRASVGTGVIPVCRTAGDGRASKRPTRAQPRKMGELAVSITRVPAAGLGPLVSWMWGARPLRAPAARLRPHRCPAR